MNKQEYLERLQECLKHKLPREEIEDIMRDYAEYFEEGRRQSQQDSQIAAKLGDPELVAQQLIEESQEQAEEKVHVGAEKKVPWSHAWGYVTDKVKDAKEKFDQWDKGEGAQERPQPEVEQPQKSEKASSGPKQHDEEGVILRFCKAIGRGCRWLMLAAIAVMLFCFVAALSMGVLTVWEFCFPHWQWQQAWRWSAVSASSCVALPLYWSARARAARCSLVRLPASVCFPPFPFCSGGRCAPAGRAASRCSAGD